MSRVPKRPSGRTARIVAFLPSLLWKSTTLSIGASVTPSPYVRQNGSSSSRKRLMRLTRPPVMVFRPVSAMVTVHGSDSLLWTVMPFDLKSKVTSLLYSA